MGKANNDGRADLAENVEQDALAALDVVGKHRAKGFIMDILTSQHLVYGVRVEHPHTITSIQSGDVEGEGGVVFEDVR